MFFAQLHALCEKFNGSHKMVNRLTFTVDNGEAISGQLRLALYPNDQRAASPKTDVLRKRIVCNNKGAMSSPSVENLQSFESRNPTNVFPFSSSTQVLQILM